MNKLAEHLKALGQISFRDFMKIALYDENHGYYTKNIRTVGRSGDFSTLATINDTLAKSIGSWITDRWKRSKQLKGNIIEIGAGDGSLAEKVLKNLKLWSRFGLRYHIVETSPKLSQIQKDHLRNRKFIVWHKRMEDALAACSGKALILSNELIDAFPAELIKWNKNEKKWHQVMVKPENDSWDISLGKEYKVNNESSIAGYEDLTDGQIIERHDDFISWFRNWSVLWEQGHMLTIDYGETFPQLYYRRPKGTIRSYYFQQRYESLQEILSRPGLQDITADVDFTDIRLRMKSETVEEIKYIKQSEFINAHSTKLAKLDPSISEDGAGSAFKVLWHQKVPKKEN